MKLFLITGLVAGLASAFPSVSAPDFALEPRAVAKKGCTVSELCDRKIDVSNHEIDYDPKNPTAAQKFSAARTNCGLLNGPCLSFNAKKQYVSTHGKHRFIPPKKSDIRGPCPALNAAANHDYLPRNGLPNLPQTIFGLGEAYGMSVDLAGFLAAYAIAIDGDILSRTWSIGGPLPKSLLSGVLGKGKLPPQGISYSHNKYEGDTSIGRCDAFTNGGDGHSLSVQRFRYAYESGMDDDRYTMDKFSQAFTKNTIRSVKANPLYFSAALFSTTLVAPAAYNFVIAMMSNHSEQSHSGYLDGNVFKSFFAIEGDYPDFKWIPGYEKIPENWYRRPRDQPYTAVAGVFGDLLAEFAAYPKSFRFGGNVNGVDSYVGVDIENFTQGAYNAKDLLKPENFRCFVYQGIEQGLPDVLRGGINDLNAATQFLKPFLKKFTGDPLDCPSVSKFKDNTLNYKGRFYSPTGQRENC